MSKYEQLVSMKKELGDLKAELAILKQCDPTPENFQRVHEIEAQAKQVSVYVRQFCRQYGMKS